MRGNLGSMNYIPLIIGLIALLPCSMAHTETKQATMDVTLNAIPSCRFDFPHPPWRDFKDKKEFFKYWRKHHHCHGRHMPPRFEGEDDPKWHHGHRHPKAFHHHGGPIAREDEFDDGSITIIY